MKTVCTLNGRIIMSQDGDAADAMRENAAQFPGAAVEVIEDSEFLDRMSAQNAASRNIQAEIDALEREKGQPRNLREAAMFSMLKDAAILQVGVSSFYESMTDDQRMAAMLSVEPSVYAANPGYRKTKDFDDQIKALRALLPK